MYSMEFNSDISQFVFDLRDRFYEENKLVVVLTFEFGCSSPRRLLRPTKIIKLYALHVRVYLLPWQALHFDSPCY